MRWKTSSIESNDMKEESGWGGGRGQCRVGREMCVQQSTAAPGCEQVLTQPERKRRMLVYTAHTAPSAKL